jgi:hypothetical protein
LILTILLTACTPEMQSVIDDIAQEIEGQQARAPPEYDPDQITIASWNIQVFGQSKASKPEVMRVISETISNYDIVAIQEIRDKSGTAIGDLERSVDALGIDQLSLLLSQVAQRSNG